MSSVLNMLLLYIWIPLIAHFISLCLGFNRILWGKGARIMRETQRVAGGCTRKVHLDSHMGSSQCAEIRDQCLCLRPGLWMALWVGPHLGTLLNNRHFTLLTI